MEADSRASFPFSVPALPPLRSSSSCPEAGLSLTCLGSVWLRARPAACDGEDPASSPSLMMERLASSCREPVRTIEREEGDVGEKATGWRSEALLCIATAADDGDDDVTIPVLLSLAGEGDNVRGVTLS